MPSSVGRHPVEIGVKRPYKPHSKKAIKAYLKRYHRPGVSHHYSLNASACVKMRKSFITSYKFQYEEDPTEKKVCFTMDTSGFAAAAQQHLDHGKSKRFIKKFRKEYISATRNRLTPEIK